MPSTLSNSLRSGGSGTLSAGLSNLITCALPAPPCSPKGSSGGSKQVHATCRVARQEAVIQVSSDSD